MMPSQQYSNHRTLPFFYVLCGATLLAHAGFQIWQSVRVPTGGAFLGALAACAVLVVWFRARRNAQIMQDRIIRLEMQVRLRLVLPAEQPATLARLNVSQLVALRFAADTELPELVRRTVAGELSTNDAIKRAIREWQPDHMRV